MRPLFKSNLLASFIMRNLCFKSNQPVRTAIKIYTKTGDKGSSVTIAGDRRPKDDAIFEALGATDELSSAIGLAREFCSESSSHKLTEELLEIQCVLQDAGSNIATPRSMASPNQINMTEFDGSAVENLEKWIDKHTEELPPLTNFILPGGGKASASLHMARSICRRAERRLGKLVRDEEVNIDVGRYLNRLSDYLFTAARIAAKCDGQGDSIYRRPKGRDRKDK